MIGDDVFPGVGVLPAGYYELPAATSVVGPEGLLCRLVVAKGAEPAAEAARLYQRDGANDSVSVRVLRFAAVAPASAYLDGVRRSGGCPALRSGADRLGLSSVAPPPVGDEAAGVRVVFEGARPGVMDVAAARAGSSVVVVASFSPSPEHLADPAAMLLSTLRRLP